MTSRGGSRFKSRTSREVHESRTSWSYFRRATARRRLAGHRVGGEAVRDSWWPSGVLESLLALHAFLQHAPVLGGADWRPPPKAHGWIGGNVFPLLFEVEGTPCVLSLYFFG